METILASLNGTSAGGWTSYAKRLESAGADALELNLYEVATSPDETGAATPSYMSFEVTSEQQEDITTFLDQVRALVHDAGLVLVSTTPVGPDQA